MNARRGAWLLALAGAGAYAATGIDPAPGLITISAIHDSVDYEALSVLQKFDAAGTQRVVRWTRDDATTGRKRSVSATFLTRPEDLEGAHRIVVVWQAGDPENIPGALDGYASRVMRRELLDQGATSLVFGAAPVPKNAAALLGGLLGGRKYYRGTLLRVEKTRVPVSVLLDGRRTDLPAIHARGAISVGGSSGMAELWILDDERLPMLLRWDALGASVRIVRIDNPPKARAPAGGNARGIELSPGKPGADCRAELHGIYFASGSAELLPESRPELERVAALLGAHADWHVRIEGHTDNLGGAAYNLALSNDRANAVRDALVAQLHVPAQRLAAQGFGSTRPVESNDTIEGRAHNRRVELVRKCP